MSLLADAFETSWKHCTQTQHVGFGLVFQSKHAIFQWIKLFLMRKHFKVLLVCSEKGYSPTTDKSHGIAGHVLFLSLRPSIAEFSKDQKTISDYQLLIQIYTLPSTFGVKQQLL